MDATSKKLVTFLSATDIELRLSSLRILSELGELKGETLQAVDRLLQENDPGLNRKVLNVLSGKPTRDLMTYFIPFLKEEDGVREQSLKALESLGSSASSAIQKEYKATQDSILKRPFVTLISRIPSRNNFEFLAKAILSERLELQKHICDEIRAHADKYHDKDKKLFESVIRENIRIADKNKNVAALTSFVIILGCLNLKSSLNILMRFSDSKRPTDLRRHSLISLSKLPLTGKIDENLQKNLLICLTEGDYPNIVQNVLLIIEPIAASKRFEKVYLELMSTNPHNPVKNFALGKLAQLNSKVALDKLATQLMSGDSFVYEKAQKVLEQSEKGFEYLSKRLDQIATPDAAERVGALLAIDRSRIKTAELEEMFKSVEKYLGDTGIKAQIYFTLIRKINPDFAYETTLKRVQVFKTNKKFDKARALLGLLSGTVLFNSEAKLQYAVVLLKISKKDISLAARSQDPALPLFQSLIPQKNFGLTAKVQKEKLVTPEELFYLGFHFSEKLFDQKDFGINLLKYMIKKHPRSPHAKKAKKKLESVGATAYVPSVGKRR